MPDELSADDKALIERALKNIRTPNRRIVPAQKVTGHLKKDYVDQLVNQLKSGAL
jgi:hypothetical protein